MVHYEILTNRQSTYLHQPYAELHFHPHHKTRSIIEQSVSVMAKLLISDLCVVFV